MGKPKPKGTPRAFFLPSGVSRNPNTKKVDRLMIRAPPSRGPLTDASQPASQPARKSSSAAVPLHYTIHYTLYTIHYTLYTIHYTLHTTHYQPFPPPPLPFPPLPTNPEKSRWIGRIIGIIGITGITGAPLGIPYVLKWCQIQFGLAAGACLILAFSIFRHYHYRYHYRYHYHYHYHTTVTTTTTTSIFNR